jgi:hypothetical protein
MKAPVRIGVTRNRLITIPFYASDAEIAELVLGSKADQWPNIVRQLERDGLPARSHLITGLRYFPAVIDFFDIREGVRNSAEDGAPVEDDGPENWNPV